MLLCNNFPSILVLLLVTIISRAAADNTNSSDILHDVSPFIIIYKNGTVKRLIGTNVVPPSANPMAGVISKDVQIDPGRQISARIFLPENAEPRRILPLLVYFHGGAFVTESAFSPTYNNYLNSLVGRANVAAVSVNYQLAPENPLPTGYEDSWRALQWVFNSRRRDTWLRDHVDFKNVYVAGDSAGGNIAHNVVLRAGQDKTGRFELTGLFLNCPHFWGSVRIGHERRDPRGVALMESIWLVAYPNSTGFDDPASNPGMDPRLSELGCKRVLVYVAEDDVLRDRGVEYARTLRKSGWRGHVKVVDVKGEGHVFNLRFPNTTKAKTMMVSVASFLNGGRRRAKHRRS